MTESSVQQTKGEEKSEQHAKTDYEGNDPDWVRLWPPH